MVRKYPESGFTLIELMVTLAVVAILLSVAVPSFTTTIANNRLSSTTNSMIGALNFARAESVKRGRVVEVTAVSSAGNSNEWGGGWRVWVDQGTNGYDAGEEIREFSDISNDLTINGPDSLTNFRFRPNGFVGPAPAAGTEYTFQVCDDRSGETGRVINIHTSGRVRSDTFVCG